VRCAVNPTPRKTKNMKQAFHLLHAAVLSLALTGGAVAAEKKSAATKVTETAKEAVAKATGKPMPMNLRADMIDTKAKTITMKRKSDGAEIKHVLTDSTVIMNGETPAKLSDIKAGDSVGGTRLKKSDTEYEVVKITKFGPAAPKKAKTEGEAKPAEKKP